MIGVDLIGQIRHAYIEQQRPIKEIVRMLSVSRATVRKVIRGHPRQFQRDQTIYDPWHYLPVLVKKPGALRSRALDSARIDVPHCGWRDDRRIAGMKRGDINNRLSVGGQPTEDHLSSLKAEGFAAIINLRRDGEANQPLDPAREGMAAAAAGLQYFHIPVNSADPKGEQVAAVRAALEQIEGPVYVHCQGGGRACTMTLLATAPASGYGAKDVIAEAERAGFAVTNPVMADFVAAILGEKP